jgi:hypothetical protein
MSFFWRELSGREGKITIPSLGAVIGIMSSWKLTRREESTPGDPGVLTLRASLSYVNPVLVEQPLEKSVIVKITKDKEYRVAYERLALNGQDLLLEGATLCRVET